MHGQAAHQTYDTLVLGVFKTHLNCYVRFQVYFGGIGAANPARAARAHNQVSCLSALRIKCSFWMPIQMHIASVQFADIILMMKSIPLHC